MERVTTTNLISVVSGNVNMPKATIKAVVNSLIDTIKNELEEGNDVYIKGLVNFKHKVWKEREGYNISEGKKIIIPERHVVRANVSPKLQVK